jgi:hypothetical protein
MLSKPIENIPDAEPVAANEVRVDGVSESIIPLGRQASFPDGGSNEAARRGDGAVVVHSHGDRLVERASGHPLEKSTCTEAKSYRGEVAATGPEVSGGFSMSGIS